MVEILRIACLIANTALIFGWLVLYKINILPKEFKPFYSLMAVSYLLLTARLLYVDFNKTPIKGYTDYWMAGLTYTVLILQLYAVGFKLWRYRQLKSLEK